MIRLLFLNAPRLVNATKLSTSVGTGWPQFLNLGSNRKFALASKLATVLIVLHVSAVAQVLPVCSWPLESTGSGITNVAYPDTNATYWTMPFDSVRWKSIIITGQYPEARFFSLSLMSLEVQSWRTTTG